ncbi:MAG: hypothetical protein MUF83_10330 [Acidimicrobiales bacterium]|jgi:hypothetical protein|nr:hypothetical protein [Acidimicrobiales bacterium]
MGIVIGVVVLALVVVGVVVALRRRRPERDGSVVAVPSAVPAAAPTPAGDGAGDPAEPVPDVVVQTDDGADEHDDVHLTRFAAPGTRALAKPVGMSASLPVTVAGGPAPSPGQPDLGEGAAEEEMPEPESESEPEPVGESVVEPVEEPVESEPVGESVVEPVEDPVEPEPVGESVVEPVEDPVESEPVGESVVEPVEDPVEPGPESEPEPEPEPVGESVVEPVEDPVEPESEPEPEPEPVMDDLVAAEPREAGQLESPLESDAGAPSVADGLVAEDAAGDAEAPTVVELQPEPDLDPVDLIIRALIDRARERHVAVADVAAELLEQADLEDRDIDAVFADLVDRTATDEDLISPAARLDELTASDAAMPRRPGQMNQFAQLDRQAKKRVIIRVLCLLVALKEDNRLRPSSPRSEAETRQWPLARVVWPLPAPGADSTRDTSVAADLLDLIRD